MTELSESHHLAVSFIETFMAAPEGEDIAVSLVLDPASSLDILVCVRIAGRIELMASPAGARAIASIMGSALHLYPADPSFLGFPTMILSLRAVADEAEKEEARRAAPFPPPAVKIPAPIPAQLMRNPSGCPDPDYCRGNGSCVWDCRGTEASDAQPRS